MINIIFSKNLYSSILFDLLPSGFLFVAIASTKSKNSTNSIKIKLKFTSSNIKAGPALFKMIKINCETLFLKKGRG